MGEAVPAIMPKNWSRGSQEVVKNSLHDFLSPFQYVIRMFMAEDCREEISRTYYTTSHVRIIFYTYTVKPLNSGHALKSG